MNPRQEQAERIAKRLQAEFDIIWPRGPEYPLASQEQVVAEVLAAMGEEQEENARLVERVGRLEAALTRLRDCDWTIGIGDRMDPVRKIARDALEGKEWREAREGVGDL